MGNDIDEQIEGLDYGGGRKLVETSGRSGNDSADVGGARTTAITVECLRAQSSHIGEEKSSADISGPARLSRRPVVRERTVGSCLIDA